jgi:hypothetical protein
MKYNRFVHIVIRDGIIKAVLTSASEGRKVLNQMRDDAMPAHKYEDDTEEYTRKWMEEELKWHLEKWPLCNTMST